MHATKSLRAERSAISRGPRVLRLGREEWPALLRELSAQLDAGRVYPRDLPELGTALDTVVAAYNRRPRTRRPRA